MMHRYLGVLLGSFAWIGWAAEQTTPAIMPFDTNVLLKTSITLLFVLALILACAWFMKRLNAFRWMGNPNMQVVSALQICHQEHVMLVRVGVQYLLLGVSPGGIETLQTYDEAPFDLSTEKNNGIAFAKTLQQVFANQKS